MEYTTPSETLDSALDKCEEKGAMQRYEVIAEFRVVQVLEAKNKQDAIQQLACNITDTFDFGYELSSMVKYTTKEANNEDIGIKESVSCLDNCNAKGTRRK